LYYVYNNDIRSVDTIPGKPYPDFLSFSGRDSCWLAGGRDILDSAGWELWTQEIFRTTDGGKTWDKQRDTVQNSHPLHDVKFYDNKFGMASGNKALVLITEDGGENWKEELITFPFVDGSNRSVYHIQIPSRNSAFVVYNYQYIYKWTRPPTSVAEEYKDYNINITPIPATDYIEIQMNNHARQGVVESVTVFDVLGVEVLNTSTSFLRKQESHGNFNEIPNQVGNDSQVIRLDISSLSPGVYFVKIVGKVSKFVKI